ncbi:uncharacterized protein LOC131671332 [Phymastichus coffea]|uniref:uncharacterized protein LOC131671332 n=1 Tax=Phymastichus coffea TaxID=108790 RepID=UPI00273BC3EB|nr:uncharacterized protein LOC131671332 [Phymastichus coffea]
MKRFKAADIQKRNKEINEQANKTRKELINDEVVGDIGNKLLTHHDLSLQNVEELGRLIAKKHKYDKQQLIVCSLTELSIKLDSYNNDIDKKPMFFICHDDNSTKVTFCIIKQCSTIVCLFKNFSRNDKVETVVKNILEKHFNQITQFKISNTENNINQKDLDIICLKTLETMMIYFMSDEKENFIKSFANSEQTFFQWLKEGTKSLKNELFTLVKDGYYATIASDIDKLSKDTEFKKGIKEFIDSIPLIEEVNNFKNYQNLLKEFTELDENNLDFESDKIKQLYTRLEHARANAFNKLKKISFDIAENENGSYLLNIEKKFPNQMKKFTQIFEPLVRCETDKELDERLKDISLKLDLDYEKLKSFFDIADKMKQEINEHATPDIKNIEDVINALPKLKSESSDLETYKTFETLLAQTIVEKSEKLSVESLKEGYIKIKNFYKLWSNKDALKINQWAKSKQGKLADSEIFEAVAVLDRANQLITGGHRLRDTQILSVLTFLQQKDKGQLTQIQTGEGKTTIVSILAAIKALKGEKVDVITSNPVLAVDGVKDKQLFYNLLNLSVTTNNLDEDYKSGPRKCYVADIIYGSISNFQFDYLKDSFFNLKTRAERPFQSIILDEVDSMIIDNASHIAKLSEPFPGMENLKYIYIKIWQELHKAEKRIIHELKEQLKVRAEEIQKLSLSEDESQSLYEEFLDELEESIIQKIKDSIKQAKPTKNDIIPSHIQEYADNALDRWISSALDAKFVYREDEQYVIGIKNEEKIIQPVDYANTGMTLKNTIWQHGLHQFLQLKHNLHLTSENLTSSCISNLSYINKYGNQIFGLTGTLGSEAEQRLLSSIYNVGYAKIPTYKEKKFEEIPGDIVDDEIFIATIANDVISKIKSGRAVLIICETIKDAKAIQKELRKSNIAIRMFLSEENAYITEKEVDSGDVVIATNIAGRGTDFKTSEKLENNKGLHVCIAFLPCNKRVEDQAFGRTARQGNQGSAQLVIKRSEVNKLNIISNCFKVIKYCRDQKEKDRIQLIREIKIPELKFQDELFEQFSILYRKLEINFEYKREYKFVLDDLKEFWAFWLNKQNFKGLKIADKIVKEEFRKFESEAVEVIKGKIQFNPYYSIQQAEYFISSNGKLSEAEQSLNHALRISKNPEILYSAYLKLFEIAIERGRVFTDKCRQALKDVFYIPMVQPDREYKRKAKDYLELAKKAFKKEFDYIEYLCNDEEFLNILRNDVNDEATETVPNEIQQENLFIKHIISKQQALNLEMNHADKLIREIDTSTAGFSIGCRIPDYLCNLKPNNETEQTMKKIITNSELAEIAANGSNITYALRAVHDVCPQIAKAAKIQIGGGIALIGTGICFPPACPITSSIGGTMITEGICDIAIDLLNTNSDGKFHKEAYIKGKIISYGISLLTMGIKAILQCPKILEKAKNACRWISDTLRKCPVWKCAFESVARYFDKLADWFEKMEAIAKFNSMTKMEQLKFIENARKSNDLKHLKLLGSNISQYQHLLKELRETGRLQELTRLHKLGQVSMNISINVVFNIGKHILITKIVFPVLASVMSDLRPIVKQHVEKAVKENIDREKLKYTSFEEITTIIQKIKNSIDYKTIIDILKNTILGICKHCNNWKVQIGALAFDQFSSWYEIYNCAKNICRQIDRELKSSGESVNKNVDEIIDKLIKLLSEEIFSYIVSNTIKTCEDVYAVGKSARANYRRKAKIRKKCIELCENFKMDGLSGQEQIIALSDCIRRPIRIHEENGNIVDIGEHYPGDPIDIHYFPPDKNNSTGHYVPFGKNKNWSSGDNKNNCLFDAVGFKIGADADELRQKTQEKIEADPTQYIALHVRDVMGTDILLEGGRTNQPILEDHYPSHKCKIKVAFGHSKVLANLRNSLNKHKKECDEFNSKTESQKFRYRKHNKSIPQFGNTPDKDEMMMGSVYVKFSDGSKLKLVTVSGDKPFSVRQSISEHENLNCTTEPIDFTWSNEDFEFVDPGKPRGKVYDVYNKQETNFEYSKSCAGQKLLYAISEYLKANPHLEIEGDIYMAESWCKPDTGKFSSDQVIINKSCSHCEIVLPIATGKNYKD